uniref:SseB family protein n=1 Tax=Paracoccus sphaerophysae TaxID=690417 RepID=UPI0023586A56
MTELDRLCATIPFHDADPAQRAAVLRRLADSELHAALAADPVDDRADLRMFDLPGGTVALAADDAAELAGFLGGPVAHVSLPGRVLAAELAQAGQGLLVNPGRPSEMLLDAATLGWLVAALAPAPDSEDTAPQRCPRRGPRRGQALR